MTRSFLAPPCPVQLPDMLSRPRKLRRERFMRPTLCSCLLTSHQDLEQIFM